MKREILEAIENAASAANDVQTPLGIGRAGYSAVSPRRFLVAIEIVRRFLEYAPGELTVAELRDEIEGLR